MKRITAWLPWAVPAALAVVLGGVPSRAGEVGFAEDFALSRDRTTALRQLIPGTEDYYYYHALHHLNTEQFEKAEELTRPWHQRFGQTARLTEIQTRHALLTYEKDPQRSLQYIRNRLGLHYSHQKEIVGVAPNLPTSLDPKLISRPTLKALSYNHWSNLDNFEDAALDWVAAEELPWEKRRHLLQRLTRPDVPNLPKLVFDDLRAPHPQDFGSYPVHVQMTKPQLEDLLRLKPDLLTHGAFVRVWITKLQPGADADWRRDWPVARAYFQRLEEFVSKLVPSHNALYAHVLYHRLALDRADGVYDKDRFLAYLKLPRRMPYMPRKLLEDAEFHRFPADLNADFAGHTLLSPVRADEELVRSYLKHFFAEGETTKTFETYIDADYLKHLIAETKVELGLGDPETWASQLPPDAFARLRERIDIDFAYTNKADFTASEPVRLDLFVKNVPTLLVKVFEVNTQNYYRTQLREVDTDVNLDGLVPNAEEVHQYGEPPLRRVARRFEFPQLNKPGVYVIDFIGAGKSSRALVRKGRLKPVVGTGTAGQTVTVVDENGAAVPEAVVWVGGNEYAANKDGTATIPFTAQPGRRPVVLSRGDFASLDHIDHQPEAYRLAAGIHVERESLLTQRVAPVLVRPGVFLNGQPVSVKLLEDVKLRITSTDLSGIATSTEVPNFKLFEDRESVHEFRVPPRLATLSITLAAKVKSLSLNQPIDLAAGESFALNGIDKTDKIEDLHLTKFAADYAIEVLGRTGEPKQDRPVQLAIKHRDFKQPVNVTLKTDPRGRVVLGPLHDITTVTATGPEGTSQTWTLPEDHAAYRQVLHARAGEIVTVPYLGTAEKPSREELALFEVKGGLVLADRFDALAIRDGLVELRGLPAGDYTLWLKRQAHQVLVRVTDGPTVKGHIVGRTRQLELPGLKPVQIRSVIVDGDRVTIQLKDASVFARVHVFASRYRPAFPPFAAFAKVRDAELSGVVPVRPESVYLTGRNIGDEYRYVLDRRGMKKYPGNMLDRPQLLLNPWAVRSTDTGEQEARAGEDFARKGEPPPSAAIPASPAPDARISGVEGALAGYFANLDYLADAAAVLPNLIPDKDGTIRIDRKLLGPHPVIQVVAVDPLSTTSRITTLPEQPAAVLDLRFKDGLDPAGFFTRQRQVSVLPKGQPFVLSDAVASRFEPYDSLPKVFSLFATLSKDPRLVEFAFLTNWPRLKPEEKRANYSKHASHELNFFLFHKDPEFFNTVVKPYLANKKDKTFLDHWLLGDDLRPFLDPWRHARLNAAERVLLAKRLAGEPAKTARHIDDLLRLRPPAPDRVAMLFDTAVQAGSLAADDALGLGKMKADKELKDRAEAAGQPAGGAPGGFGGRGGASAGMGLGGQPAPAKPKALAAVSEAERLNEEMQKRDGKSAGKDMEKKLRKLEDADKDEKKAAELQFFGDERARLGVIRQLYRRLDPTMEWAENNYHHLPIAQQSADLIPIGRFWLDYARHEGNAPFLSPHLADASHTFAEMALALAVLDLPFEAAKHDVKFDGGKMTLSPGGPVVAFHEEVRPAAAPDGKVPVLVGQNFFRHGDRFREEGGEKSDKYVTGEYLVHTVYGCQIVVTNPTSSRQRLSVLVQLPVGSVPVGDGRFTRTVPLDLEPYRTQAVEYLFYFPKPGKFAHFPAQVSKDEKVVAAAKPATFDVVATPSKPDTESWDYVSQNGTDEQVLAMMARENVLALNKEKIAFRMKDRAFFEKVIALLKERHDYHPTLWSYALLHNDPATAKEFLTHADQLIAEAGGPIDTPLLTINPVERHQFEHLEYKPLVNARTHALGARRQIVNDRLHEQYHRLLKNLSYRRDLGDEHLLAVTYYLLVQDRISEALAAFARVNPDRLPTKAQYDYCAAYLAMYEEDAEKARAIAERYADHPVDRWRNSFAAVRHHLDEAANRGLQVADINDRSQRQGQLAATEPGFEVNLDGKAVSLSWQNLDSVKVNYYLMDVELLFSRTPFAGGAGGQFAFTRPNATKDVRLPAGERTVAVPLPEDLVKRNVLVEVSAGGKTRAVPYYANAMDVKLVESYGHVKVTDAAAGKPLPKVYVKVYARLADGRVKFHKDGYTDLRGRFDYASVSTPERSPVERFALMVLSDDRGATIKEAAPPQQ